MELDLGDQDPSQLARPTASTASQAMSHWIFFEDDRMGGRSLRQTHSCGSGLCIHHADACRSPIELKDNTVIVVLGASGDLAKKKTVCWICEKTKLGGATQLANKA